VSRGRKPKQSNKRRRKGASNSPGTSKPDGARAGTPGSALTVVDRLLGPPERPPWFGESIKRVLDDADVVTSARGPRELDQLTVELLGAELHRAVHEERQGLWFGRWFAELADAATDRIKKEAAGHSVEPLFWLLHGLAAMAPPGLQPELTAPNRAKKWLPDDIIARLPEWLTEVPRIAATGEVFRMRDAYGTRFAVIAGFSYPRARDRSVFLFDIDASGFVTLADAGVFDDPEQAATAWRTHVGDAGDHARPEPVEDADELLCLVHLDTGDERAIGGNESRPVMDNWFRTQRRIHDLGRALRKRGMPLPAAVYRDVDTTVMTEQFAAWYTDAHGTKPDPEAVDALAGEWVEGTLPEAWYAVSPRRVEFQLELIGDWIPDHPVTAAVTALMPDWVRWLGERAGLPEHLREHTISAASAR
jgi:hypothetical protein